MTEKTDKAPAKKAPAKKQPARKRRTAASKRADNIANNAGRLQKREDYWYNASTGVGTSTYDRQRNMTQRSQGRIPDEELQTFYIDNDIAATVIDRVPHDALRQGYEVRFDDADPELEAEIVSWAEGKYQLSNNVLRARTWARLFGGAALFFAADNGQELTEPLLPGSDVRFIRPYARPDLRPVVWYDTPADALTSKYGTPAVFEVRTSSRNAHNIVNIHESRFHVFQGLLTTSQRYRENDGWGDSVLTRVIDVLKRFDSAWMSVMSLMTDSSVAIYKIKELMAHLESDNMDALLARLQLIDQQKNNMRPVVLDADGESYERVAAQLAEAANVLMNAMIRVSAAAGLPVSILFGQAPAGLNATPEGDLRNLYDRVAQERRDEIAPALVHSLEMLLAQTSSPTGGEVPAGLRVEFPSLWQTDPVQQATLYQMVATADGIYMANGVVSREEVAIARAATSIGDFGFPRGIDVEARKEILAEMSDPTPVVADPTALPEEGTPPSNARPPADDVEPVAE